MGAVLVFVGIGVIAAVAVYLSYYFKKKRQEGFGLVARQLGFQFSIQDPFETVSEPFKLFQKGDGRGVENVLWGNWQATDIREFDYWYYDESTDSNGHRSKTYHHFSCVMAPVRAACSPLTIEHENVLTRLADHLAMHDIEFESEDFNKAFDVKSIDKKFASDFIDARMMQWLLQHAAGFSFEVVADRVLVSCKRLQPTEIVPLVGTAKGFVDEVPNVVYSLYPKNAPQQAGSA